MRKLILLALGVLVAGALLIVILQPDTMLVERSTSIAAPQAAVFAYVNDLHRWESWSPWAPMDPNMEKTYGGPPTGAGASYSWKGNNKVGEGRMTVTESAPNERVGLHLEFIKPFKSESDVVFVLKGADATHTLISWTMQSKTNFVFKAMGLFIDMDHAVGGDFERGLAALKARVESLTPPAGPAPDALPAAGAAPKP